ncbi:MAG: hypothetical protein JO353_12210 [Phycisphaerae bacterium]|nr:hypothetical protein [Phycisphaerae bacterium]
MSPPNRSPSAVTPFTLYLCHHTHTDIGYTHDQPVVMELHARFLDQALTLVDRYRDRGDATFRWTCEVTSTVEHWLASASTRDVDRFVAAAHRGQIEVCALKYNLTPLASHARLIEMLNPALRMRKDLGIPIRVAMNSDVNGQSWGLTDVLLDHGIDALTMSINEHFGRAPEPRPGAMNWQSPSGRQLLVWNGHTYAHTAWLCIGQDMAIARDNVHRLVSTLQAENYRLPFLYMQFTHPGPQNDNIGAVPWLSDWIERFNTDKSADAVRLVITTPSTFINVLRNYPGLKPTPVSGDWSDWWNFGAASTPIETAVNRTSQWRLADADLLAALQPRAFNRRLRNKAEAAIDLWNEHTWGADCSVHRPADLDTTAQWYHKAYPAYEARAITGLLARDGMTALSHSIETEQRPGLLVFNPTAYPRSETLVVAARLLRSERVPLAPTNEGTGAGWPHDSAYQTLVDRVEWREHEPIEIGPIELPPFGWTVVTDRDAATAAPLQSDAISIISDTVELSGEPGSSGLTRLSYRGREWATADGLLPFGAVVMERVSGVRGDIMRFDDREIPARSRRPIWNSDVPIERHLPRDVMCSVHQTARSATLTQTYSLPTCRGIV